LDRQGDLRIGCVDMMKIDEPVDLVVSYPSLIHIAGLGSAIAKMFGGHSDQAGLCSLQT